MPSSEGYSWRRDQTHLRRSKLTSIAFLILFLSCTLLFFNDWCLWNCLSSVKSSHSVVSDSLRPHGLQHASPPSPSPTPGVHPNPCPSSRWCHPAISSSVIPSPHALNLSQDQGLFQWVSSSHQVAKVLQFQLQHQSVQWTPRTDLL